MKRLLLIFLAFYSIAGNAQQYNNEWIDYNKTYYKFKVATTGLFRISQATLSGVGLGSTDAAHFQLWKNGIEVPLYTTVQAGALPAAGYIEFWGEINDGKPDNQLYRNTIDQLNNTKSLFTDTAAYFLTVNPGTGNRRLVATPNQIPSGATPEPFFIYTKMFPFNEAIHFGRPDGSGSSALYTASYEQGKGWASADINNGGAKTIAENLYAFTGGGAPAATVRLNVVGNANATRNVKFSINGNSIFDNQLSTFNYLKLSATLGPSVLTGANESFVVTNAATTTDRVRVALIELTYARTFHFGGANNFRFQLPATSTGKYLEISGFTFSGTPVLYDLSNGRRYEVNASNPALLKVFIQPSVIAQDMVLVNQDAAGIKAVSQLETRNFINYLAPANQGDYLLITHSNILDGSNGAKPVEEYRAYRASAAGGGYNAKVYMIDQLIDQFAFGIKNNPLSVREFSRWARNKFSTLPKQIFIAAKGVNFYLSRIYESSNSSEVTRLNLVPTMGNPGSDLLLTSEGSSSVSLTPIGRLSVVNGDELATYLSKVKQYENALNNTSPLVSESAWKKNVIHMVGANDQATIDLLYQLLNNHKRIINDTLYGVNVVDYVKESSGALQQSTIDRLTNQINGGVGMLSYFGHSSASNLAFNLDNPLNYTNLSKYPLFNMMGCNVGDIFGFNSDRISGPDVLSEKYVLAKDRGCIGMMAGTSVGYVNTLDVYNTRFYQLLSTGLYAKTVGEQMQQTVKKVFEVSGESYQLLRSQCEQYTLNGDPAVRLYQFDKPDYVVEDQMVNVSPSFVSVAEPGFGVNTTMLNLGKAVNNKIVVELKRTYPDLSTAVIRRDTIPGIKYIDSLTFNVPIDPIKDKGLNKITITIDPENTTLELHETNNSVTKDVFIFEDELRPVFPYNYAIVNNQGIKFAASSANPLATSRNYLFEIDTTENFNSSAKVGQAITSSGGVVEFTPGVTFNDNRVYYWRVASAPTGNEQPKWNSSSFIYISGSEFGFNQSQRNQFNDELHENITVNQSGEFVYDSLQSTILLQNSINPYANVSQVGYYSLVIDDVFKQYGLITSPSGNPQENSLRFYLINNKNLSVIDNVDLGTSGRYGSYRPLPANAQAMPGFFQFDISTIDARKTVMSFLDSIPSGYYVCLTSNQWESTILPSVWQSDTATLGKNNSLYHKLKSIGLTKIDSVQSVIPYMFIYQKGKATPLAQVIGSNIADRLLVRVKVPVSKPSGVIRSPVFKTATLWNRLEWDGMSAENPSYDNVLISILGIDNNGVEKLLKSNISMLQKSVDLSTIDAKAYPGLRIIMRSTDSTDRSPYQLKYWRLLSKPAPEGAIAPNIYFSMKDTLEVGEPLNFGVAFKNISSHNFDSLKVKLSIRDKNNSETIIALPNQKALVAGDTVKVSVPLATRQYTGTNNLYVEFNPNNHQPEQYHFNNFLYKSFFVKGDSVNPFLDVTFDGVHILNKDIVSAKPDILVKLTDDAKWMLLNSTDLIKMQLKYPDGTLKDFDFNNDTLVFTPASQGSQNAATVNFKPYLKADGNYELIVSAKDQSGNDAGGMQYRVAFQVINKPMISNLLNYPNPFTTSTAFVFTLTGSQLPQNIRIQILTITGKIVKEITKNELGPLKIGRNITEYKWDGTDQYGQKLANGVYLYRVITNLNGKQLDKYTAPNDNSDKYFNNGYGKMYLMR